MLHGTTEKKMRYPCFTFKSLVQLNVQTPTIRTSGLRKY